MKTLTNETKKTERKAGILLPVFSLPSAEGIGTLGREAYDFVDFLAGAGMRIWQVLPLLPTGYGDSPYQSCASDALNHYFIDLRLLVERGLLSSNEIENVDWGARDRVAYEKLFEYKARILRLAFSRFDRSSEEWKEFLLDERYRDYAIFMTLKEKFAYACWNEWPKPYRERESKTIEDFTRAREEEISFWQFTQYIFLQQWRDLKAYANSKGVSIMGDMPIYVAYDSVETWRYGEELFVIGEDGSPDLRAGVPPDAFSEDGQLWGNPVYNWDKMQGNGYAWWKKRIDYAFTLFDIVRIDHFRGFDRFYAVEKDAVTAKEGSWKKGPGAKLFASFKDKAIVAEDLGVIDDGVREMMKETGYPGMKVLSFGYDGAFDNEHKASNHLENVYAYTGTHDNAPVKEWIEEMDEEQLADFVAEINVENTRLGLPTYATNAEKLPTVDELCETILEQSFASKARVTIVPMQDALGLGAESRINRPSSVSGGNWSFRFDRESFAPSVSKKLKKLLEKHDR